MEAMLDIDTFSLARKVTGSGPCPPDEPGLDVRRVARMFTSGVVAEGLDCEQQAWFTKAR